MPITATNNPVNATDFAILITDTSFKSKRALEHTPRGFHKHLPRIRSQSRTGITLSELRFQKHTLLLTRSIHLFAKRVFAFSGTHFVVKISGIFEIVLRETGKTCLANHLLGCLRVEAQSSESGAAFFGKRRRHTGRNRETVQHREHRVLQVVLEFGFAPNVFDEPCPIGRDGA
jgi:hypothetical protein